MGIVDYVLIALIVTGAVYLLYRSIWKKGGYCHGCSSSGTCGQDPGGAVKGTGVAQRSKARGMKGIPLMVAAFFLVAASVSRADEISYTKHIKPLFEAHCSDCHGKDAAPDYYAFKQEKEKWVSVGQGMRLDTYLHLIFFTAWPDTGSLMRRLDDGKSVESGKPGNMYRHLGSTEEERQRNLKTFKEWVGSWVVKKWPDVTKEELNGIKVRY
jgi:hypothetical protein